MLSGFSWVPDDDNYNYDNYNYGNYNYVISSNSSYLSYPTNIVKFSNAKFSGGSSGGGHIRDTSPPAPEFERSLDWLDRRVTEVCDEAFALI